MLHVVSRHRVITMQITSPGIFAVMLSTCSRITSVAALHCSLVTGKCSRKQPELESHLLRRDRVKNRTNSTNIGLGSTAPLYQMITKYHTAAAITEGV
jgi:hypothetical protein